MSDVIYLILVIVLLSGAHAIGKIEGRADGKAAAMATMKAYVAGQVDARCSHGTNPTPN